MLWNIIAWPVMAQDSLSNIKELETLLQQRKDRFEAYAQSADNRSGIFGNKTKKDLEQSREILLEIVKTDNVILTTLEKAIVQRGMAKADYSVNEMDYKQTIERLTAAADTLNTQLIAAKERNLAGENEVSEQRNISYLLLSITLIFAGVIVYLWRRPKAA